MKEQNDAIEEKPFLEIKRLNQELESMEKIYSNHPPDILLFKQQIEQQKLQIRKKFRRELSLFLLTALFIISIVLSTLVYSPVLFAALQAVGVILIPAYLLIERRKSLTEDEEIK
ncbi:YxlC family protein [Bacillus sp. 165]|uniref:YxlC family protein n=1 Tax=Bacillus sp. 165 TaxID=1529117 RepID=UPI001ADA1E91|nr:YxlC family protein [Bacillus sp. 165]MBO9129161.1 YxlC family protein [Bacillus sp. 165]